MPGRLGIEPDATHVQIVGSVPHALHLPGGLIGVQRIVRITPERIAHIAARRPAWLPFCLEHMPEVLARPDGVGQRLHGDPRRVEFVRLVGTPARWLLVSAKFLDEAREAWVNSAHLVAATYLTRRKRAGTMWSIGTP
jgi:hypothetical protein